MIKNQSHDGDNSDNNNSNNKNRTITTTTIILKSCSWEQLSLVGEHAATTKSKGLSLIPRTYLAERSNSYKLSFGLHIHVMTKTPPMQNR